MCFRAELSETEIVEKNEMHLMSSVLAASIHCIHICPKVVFLVHSFIRSLLIFYLLIFNICKTVGGMTI